MSHVTKGRKKLLARINRIIGQMNGLKDTIEKAEDNADCHAVMQQIASARGAMNGLLLEFLYEHIREHVALEAVEGKRLEEADVLIDAIKSFRA